MRFRRHRPEEVNVNLTPLIDVVFLLLIFFMVSTTFTKETHLQIDLPEASTEEVSESATVDTLDLVIDIDGQYSINGHNLLNSQPETLRRAILDQVADNRELPFSISADAKTPHQAVVTAMDVAGQLGFISLSITTQKPVER